MTDACPSQRPRLLVTRRLPQQALDAMARAIDIVPNESDAPLNREELKAALRNYDAVCPTITDRIDAEMLNALGRRARIGLVPGDSLIALVKC